jgi:hypothetical protein
MDRLLAVGMALTTVVSMASMKVGTMVVPKDDHSVEWRASNLAASKESHLAD